MIQDKKSSNLYEEIWGHRFKNGQTSHECMLEFLNVLRGTNYQFNSKGYFRRKSIALRQFVFKEDLKNYFEQMPSEVSQLISKVLPDDQNRQEFVRDLLRSYTIVERKRSWYAKFLFPIHEELLFVELRSNIKQERIGIERNFFARGGELYYLMLSKAENDRAKEEIGKKIKDILTKSNSAIGEIARIINETAATKETGVTYYAEDNHLAPLEPSDRDYPYLPAGHCPYYDKMTKHVQSLLRVNIEETEMLYLFNTLISLHVINYILRRAHHGCTQCSSEITCTPEIFVDCHIGSENPEIRRLSSKHFKRMELRIRSKVTQHLDSRLQQIFNKRFNEENRSMMEGYLSLGEDIKEAFYYKSLRKPNRDKIDGLLKKGQQIVKGDKSKKEEIMNKVYNLIREGLESVVLKQADKNFIPIHKAIAKEIGLAGYKVGENYRYTLSDNVVKVMVLSLLRPGDKMEFSDFVNRVWENFGLIIGLNEADHTGIYKESKLNIKYFEDNLDQFRIRLKNNGLLREYSDATAMVKNPYI